MPNIAVCCMAACLPQEMQRHEGNRGMHNPHSFVSFLVSLCLYIQLASCCSFPLSGSACWTCPARRGQGGSGENSPRSGQVLHKTEFGIRKLAGRTLPSAPASQARPSHTERLHVPSGQRAGAIGDPCAD
jgi:hypothetical protein